MMYLVSHPSLLCLCQPFFYANVQESHQPLRKEWKLDDDMDPEELLAEIFMGR